MTETEFDAAARLAEPGLRAVVQDAALRLRRSVAPDRLRWAASRQTSPAGLSVYDWAWYEWRLQLVSAPIRLAMTRTAHLTVRDLGLDIEKAAPRPRGAIIGALRLMNPAAIRLAGQIAARLIRHITLETQQAIAAVVARAMAEGLTLDERSAEIADLLLDVAGLTERQAVALGNYRRALRQRGVPRDEIGRQSRALRDRYLRQRAETIARTESIAAANAGIQATWEEAVLQGFLPPDARRRWLTARDERVCPICAPMDGQVQPVMGGMFTTPTGVQVALPPAHPNCRCAVTLDPAGL